MRYRSQVHTQARNGPCIEQNLKTGGIQSTRAFALNIVDIESLMWDDATGGSKVTKPCTHLSYVVDDLMTNHVCYHSDSLANIPNPMYRYDNADFYYSLVNQWRPSSVLSNAEAYIGVTNSSSDDLGNCVFNAYNQFVNGVRALDASVSIAESGETPRLFALWQRRLAAPSNIVNGFLSYSFGWKPLINDLRAVCRELRSFPVTVRKRLKAIGDGMVTRHYKFRLSATVNDVYVEHAKKNTSSPYWWSPVLDYSKSVNKSRVVVVTIRAKVKPKLTGDGQAILDKLGALGLIPSLATVWSVTRLSFVVDWFYNIGGAIENLQGSLTHDISDVSVCISDARDREIVVRCSGPGGASSTTVGTVVQRYYKRSQTSVPLLPSIRYPNKLMPYVLLGLLTLTQTRGGKVLLSLADKSGVSKRVSAKITAAIDRLSPRKRKDLESAYKRLTLHGGR
ncbi:TPA_asm: maturation protein [ssRNA phage Gerhypos.1_40]|jgi:hypothetical protein|uniref:Maturation protein n=2 Tax=Leviviricetes TaxID=2842243 RepID=A0A8S5L4K3_9VIRU|nr:maturation protein [ssRNA phage Gerhypos.1_40]QDH89712.1 MAG: hypothetical protein H1Bulk30206_000003 [Leviviridae sp.]DAD52122.1 TPA_asm: maturation protein [ssRNA phage Gerhypos.1_40]